MHPTDGALLAMLDEWMDPLEQRDLERHVDGCERCRQQMSGLGRQRLVVGALLNELEVPVPPRSLEGVIRRARQRRKGRRALIAAAAALFVASVAGATIRTDALRGVVRWFLPPAPAVETPVRPPLPPGNETPTVVALEPTNDVRIEFAAGQAEGELRIVLGADPRVTVTASEPVPYVLRSGKVTVANQGARADYRVSLPRTLERAVISVGGRMVFTKRQSAVVTEATREGPDSFRVALAERKGVE